MEPISLVLDSFSRIEQELKCLLNKASKYFRGF
jgi:hypothetical protein